MLCWPRAALPASCPSAGLSPGGSLRGRDLPQAPCSQASHRPRALPCASLPMLSSLGAHLQAQPGVPATLRWPPSPQPRSSPVLSAL